MQRLSAEVFRYKKEMVYCGYAFEKTRVHDVSLELQAKSDKMALAEGFFAFWSPGEETLNEMHA